MSDGTDTVATCTIGDVSRAVNVDIVRIAIWISGVDVVEDVEGVHTEHCRDAFLDGEGLLHCQIRIEESRAEVAISASSPNLIKSGAAEPARVCSCPGAEIAVAREIWSLMGYRVECAKVSMQIIWVSNWIAGCGSRMATVVADSTSAD